jgi:peptide/nickel transport system permease protein
MTTTWVARSAFLVIILYIFVSVFAPWIAPYGQTAVVGPTFSPIGGDFILGTDNLGRDMLSRLIYGARNTVGLAVLISVLSFVVGSGLGLVSAAAGGWADWILSRIVDVVMSIPPLVFALLVLAAIGPTLLGLIGTITFMQATRVYRLSRAVALDVMTLDYVQVALLRRERVWWIIGREVLPNILTPLVAEFGVRFCYVVLFISALSFLGLGIQPPAADWGSMVRDNASMIVFGDPAPFLPAIALAFLAIAVNLVVDWFLRRHAARN